MKNRILMLAAAGAALGMGGFPGIGVHGGPTVQLLQSPGGARLPAGQPPQGGIGSLLGITNRGGGGLGYGYRKPSYRKRIGCSMAQAQRNKRKGRNRLRAKGQHRKAVR